jgi:phosphate transport system substrate-binding protein
MISLLKKTVAVLAVSGTLMVSTVAMADTKLTGAGATFPNPIYQKWVAHYGKSHPDVKIDYQSIGSGGGIKGITEKTIDFAGSDAPMTKKELAAAGGEIVHIPTVAGAVVAAYNLPDFQGELKLDGATLAEIYLGRITKWNDPKIAALNERAPLPGLGITPVSRTDGSGTTFVFTNYLATQSQDFRNTVGMGKRVTWPAKNGQGGNKNDGVTAAVKSTPGAIGYIELNYATQSETPFALLKNKDGKFIKATPQTVSAAGAGALDKMDKSLAVDIWNQSGAEAYPISAFTYIIVYKDLSYLKSEEKAKALVGFLGWATSADGGQKLAPSLDYAPLSEGVQKKVAETLSTLHWGGKPLAAAR